MRLEALGDLGGQIIDITFSIGLSSVQFVGILFQQPIFETAITIQTKSFK